MKNACPCGLKKTYALCCGRFISQGQKPPTPELLMRSRYTAYTRADIAYIEATMLSPASDNFDPVAASQWAKAVQWKRLKILATSTPTESLGYVEFIAMFWHKNIRQTLHEMSEFQRVEGRWYYVKGIHP